MSWPICAQHGKQSFPDPQTARASRYNKRARDRRQDGRRQVRGYVYRCRACGAWHLTRQPPERFTKKAIRSA